MKRGKELLKNTAIIGIGNFSTKIISFLLLPLYTSLLSTSDYGIYDLLLTISTFLIPVITMLMSESMFRFLIDCKTEKQKTEVISLTFVTTAICTGVFICIYVILGIFIHIPYFLLFLIYLISQVIAGLRNAFARGLGKIKSFAITNFITSLIIIILNIVFIAIFHFGIKSLLISYIISNVITSFTLFSKLKVKKYVSLKNINTRKLKEMLKYSIPLIPNSISWTIVNLSDRIVISSFLNTSMNGIYSVSYKFPNIMDTIYGFFYTAWKESAAKTIKDDDSDLFYNKVYDVLKKFMWSIVLTMICFLPLIFNILIKNEFRNAYLYIPVLVIAMYFSNISGFYGGIFSAYKNTKIMGYTTIIGAIINILVDVLLINNIGLWAAAISTLVSTIIIYLLRIIKINKYVKLKENICEYFLFILLLATSLFSYYCYNILINIIVLIVIILYSLYINKSVIELFYNKLKHHN